VHVADGWQVASWFSRCGTSVPGAGGGTAFRTEHDCSLGARDGGGDVAFVPWPGERIVLLGLTLARDGVTAYGNYFVRITANP
jgi:hypothetical protein